MAFGASGQDSGYLELQPLKGATSEPERPGACPSGVLNRLQRSWQSHQQSVPPWARTALLNLGLILLWYGLGTALSLWNKKILGKGMGLLGKGPFPAPFLMTALQFFFQHMISRAVMLLGLIRRKSTEPMTWRQYCIAVVPNGVATGLDIGLSNYSLVFITLSFYVMAKSTTPIFLLTFAVAMGVERLSWDLAAVVAVITAGLLLLVAGEAEFHLVGFVLVMMAAALAGLRWTITQALLQGKGHVLSHSAALSPVEAICQLTPVMGLTMVALSLAHERLWATLPGSPYFQTLDDGALSLGIVLVGALLAFSMVWAEFQLISNTSALTFMVAGTFKEIFTVAAAVLFFQEPFTWVNGCGLVVLMAGVALFNYQKYVKVRQGGIQPLPMDDDDKSSSTSEGDSEGERSAGPSPRRSPRRRDWRSDEEGQPPVRLHSWRSDEDALPPSRRATARRGEQPLRPGSACEPEIRVITGRQASTP